MTSAAQEQLPGWLDVSRETRDRLSRLGALLAKWNPAINLVSRATLADSWNRHILDSAQLFEYAPPGSTKWADLGSGGGFPGLVIAVLALERAPELRVVLVESDQRKAAFLNQAAHDLGLNAEVIPQRIEVAAPLQADVVSARALAPLSQLCGFAARHLRSNGVALFPKGASHAAELDAASKEWRFDLRTHASKTDASAVIYELREIAHV